MKTINKTMTHNEIYDIAVKLLNNFTDVDNIYLSAAAAFSIHKNKQNFLSVANEIEESRMSILNKYNIGGENEEIQIATENIENANKELKDLLSIESEMKIYTFAIEELDDIKFTPTQMEAILFMIQE
jgi:hypothetical protein